MATKKSGGTAKNLRDSNPQYLGVKLFGGEVAKPGAIIVRQRGTRILPGKNTRLGKDHTIFSIADGKVTFKNVRKNHFDGTTSVKKMVEVL
jgi:large subunit ribosomal protein L27